MCGCCQQLCCWWCLTPSAIVWSTIQFVPHFFLSNRTNSCYIVIIQILSRIAMCFILASMSYIARFYESNFLIARSYAKFSALLTEAILWPLAAPPWKSFQRSCVLGQVDRLDKLQQVLLDSTYTPTTHTACKTHSSITTTARASSFINNNYDILLPLVMYVTLHHFLS